VYRGQKVHLFRPSLSFLAEAQPRPKTGEDKRNFLTQVHIEFLGDCAKYKANKINLLLGVHINTFFNSICQSLPTKLEIYCYYLHHLFYGDRTIIGFVGFVANLLNIPTNGATVSV
jgi:hypothetical protein